MVLPPSPPSPSIVKYLGKVSKNNRFPHVWSLKPLCIPYIALQQEEELSLNCKFSFGFCKTSWLNSHADDGEEQMTTQRVWGTSRPMAPADVERRALTSLRELLKQVWANSTYPSLYLSTTACLCVLGWSPVSFWWKQNSQIQDVPVSCPCFWNAYHHHFPRQKSVQAKVPCSSFEEGTWWKKKLKLWSTSYVAGLLAEFSRGFCWKKTCMLGEESSASMGGMKAKMGLWSSSIKVLPSYSRTWWQNRDKFSDSNWETFTFT